jgi:cytochrome c oxidase cbb3-type subunit III
VCKFAYLFPASQQPLNHPVLIRRKSLIIFFLWIFVAMQVSGQEKDLDKGREIFITYCARCHGINGGGGEGPALNRSYLPRAANDEAFTQVIFNGIPGTGMPGSWMLSKPQADQVIRYVRSMGTIKEEPVRGDRQKGLAVFEKSKCLSCHSIGGKGNSIGPDLTGVGLRRGSAYVSEVIESPGKQKIKDQEGFIQYLVVELTTADGKNIKGVRINEDTYTIQMKDVDGNLYSFRKENLKSLKRYQDASLMPSFAQLLTPEEKQNLVAYLLTRK